MIKRSKYTLFVVFLLLSVGGFCFAQESEAIDNETKAEVIDKVAEYMKSQYVDAQVGAKMGEHIKAKHNGGDYDTFTDVKNFCKKVTSDLRDICHDKHIFVFYSPEERREVAARRGLLPAKETAEIEKMFFEMEKKENFGFKRVEVLEGNIGYINLSFFSGSEIACETVVSAMQFLSSTDAIIIDLRENGGGGGGGVGGLLASYFFTSTKVPLSGAYFRSTDSTEENWTLPYVPGKRMPDVDLYILTSSRTFSAAEDFCYSLKHLKRATVVGEMTKGGAHPVDVFIVKGDILTQISIGKSVNPITKTNWEGVGVKPHVEVPAVEALEVAHLLALKSVANKMDNNSLWKGELISLIQEIENK